MSDYPDFLNGVDIPDVGLDITINKVKRFVNDKRDNGFAGFFVEVDSPLGKRTMSLSFGSVLEDMVMQKLEGVSFRIYRYDKGEKSYISTKKPETSKNSNTSVQQGQQPPNTSRRYGR